MADIADAIREVEAPPGGRQLANRYARSVFAPRPPGSATERSHLRSSRVVGSRTTTNSFRNGVARQVELEDGAGLLIVRTRLFVPAPEVVETPDRFPFAASLQAWPGTVRRSRPWAGFESRSVGRSSYDANQFAIEGNLVAFYLRESNLEPPPAAKPSTGTLDVDS